MLLSNTRLCNAFIICLLVFAQLNYYFEMILLLLLLSLTTTSVHYEDEAVGLASSVLLIFLSGSILHFIQGMSSRSMVPPAHTPSVAPCSSQCQILSLAATVPL